MDEASGSRDRQVEQARRASWLLAGAALLAVVHFHVLPALLAGLLVHESLRFFVPRVQRRIADRRAQLLVLVLLAGALVGVLSFAILGAIAFFRSDAGSLSHLFARIALIVDDARTMLPAWLVDLLPNTGDDLHAVIDAWLHDHAAQVRSVGREAGATLARILAGMIIGAMIATRSTAPGPSRGPLGEALVERAHRLADAFRRIVFAQMRISAVNTVLTALYLVVALPLFGVHLPLTKTLIAITLIAGLLPVVGNLISNSVIVVVSLAHSPHAALASLAFLVIVHKLEYVLNARIVGGQIRAHAWELLSAMLLMEAIFGLPGLIAAPIAYAWLKDELQSAGQL